MRKYRIFYRIYNFLYPIIPNKIIDRLPIYDWIDYGYGAQYGAIKSAERTGYWNLEAANRKLAAYSELEQDIMCPIIYKRMQVRKY